MKYPTPYPDFGDKMDLDEFLFCIQSGLVTEHDGSGYFGTEEAYDHDAYVFNENGSYQKPPTWATHVAWFNK